MIEVRLYSDTEVGELENELCKDGCRFCGSDDSPFIQNAGTTLKDVDTEAHWVAGPFNVHCDMCGKDGPERKTPELAIKAWNRMPKEVKKGDSYERHDSRQRKR